MPNGRTVNDELLELLGQAIMGPNQGQRPRKNPYLSEAQERFFTQRQPQKRETLTMTQRMPTPQETRQRQAQGPQVDVRQMLREALLKEQTEIAKEERGEERKIAEEQRKAAIKEQEDKRKRVEGLQDKLATAKSDRERVEYQRQLAEMGAAPPPPELEPEEIAEITQTLEVGPGRLKDIEVLQGSIRNAEQKYNEWINDPDIEPEAAEEFWDKLGDLQTEHRQLEREKRRIQQGLARGEELEQYQAQQELEAKAAQEAELEQSQEALEQAEIERKFEEMEKRPVETREEEAKREITTEAAKAEATTEARERAKEPFRIEREKREQKRKTAQDNVKFLQQKQMASFKATLAGDKAEETALRNYIFREYEMKPDKWYEWQEKLDSYEEEEQLYRRAMVKAEEDGRPEDAEKMREKADTARASRLSAARQEPKRDEDFSTFYEKRKKELKKQVKSDTKSAGETKPPEGQYKIGNDTVPRLLKAGLTIEQAEQLVTGAMAGDSDYINKIRQYIGQ